MAIEIQLWTKALISQELDIDSSYRLANLSILVNSGTCEITGNLKAGEFNSETITLLAGQGISVSSGRSETPLSQVFKINAIGGTTNLIGTL